MTDLPPPIRIQAPWLGLLAYLALAGLMLASFLAVDATRAAWLGADAAAFRALNGSLAQPGAWQAFWAITNSRLFDAVPAALLLGLYAHWMAADGRRHWRARAGLGCALAVFTVLWVQKVIKPLLDDGRLSPTLVLPDAIRLESEPAVAWVPMLKDHAENSFPGDHAGVFLLVALVIGHVCGWRRGAVALLALPLLALPRLYGGGHWLSDQVVGGGFVGLVGAAGFLGLTKAALAWRERRAAAAA
ncbi:MAG: phosphatase PAP2 family protein [Xanthomonadales bacterium]|nr:phosphatase PAP2 family protein [Xanthomonadales bacterium]MBK7144317.1 phosphatase PAP2 family protein [Xanthomonadales bacterium]MCC6560793.1 phosphatase PAP2 family protein [Xanthomonadales bacterium]